MPNPFSDFWDFVIGNTDDHNALGAWKYLFVALFLALVIASVVIAVRNWQERSRPAYCVAPCHLVRSRARGRNVVSRDALEAAAPGLQAD